MQQTEAHTNGVQRVTAHKTVRHSAKNVPASGVAGREQSLLGGRDGAVRLSRAAWLVLRAPRQVLRGEVLTSLSQPKQRLLQHSHQFWQHTGLCARACGTQVCVALIIPDVYRMCCKGRGRGCWINQFCLLPCLANSDVAFVCDRCSLGELNVQCGWLWLLDRMFLLPKIGVLMPFSFCSDKITVEYIIILRRVCISVSSGWSVSCCPRFLKTQLRAILMQGMLDVVNLFIQPCRLSHSCIFSCVAVSRQHVYWSPLCVLKRGKIVLENT